MVWYIVRFPKKKLYIMKSCLNFWPKKNSPGLSETALLIKKMCTQIGTQLESKIDGTRGLSSRMG